MLKQIKVWGGLENLFSLFFCIFKNSFSSDETGGGCEWSKANKNIEPRKQKLKLNRFIGTVCAENHSIIK